MKNWRTNYYCYRKKACIYNFLANSAVVSETKYNLPNSREVHRIFFTKRRNPFKLWHLQNQQTALRIMYNMYKKEYKKHMYICLIFMNKNCTGKGGRKDLFITGVVIIVIGGECTSFRFRLRLVGVVTLLKNISHLEWIRRKSHMWGTYSLFCHQCRVFNRLRSVCM